MLDIRNLSVGYQKSILSGVTFAPKQGQLTLLLGTNGSGKSTLLKTMAGLLPPLAGHLLLDGRDMKRFSPNQLAKRIAMLPQIRQVPELTVEQFVSLGRFPHRGYFSALSANDKDHIAHSMERCGLSPFKHRMLHSLSGGERQRAYIALCLAQDTEFILLDEPTTFLDIGHQFEVLALLRDLCTQGKTLVAVLHDLASALEYADSIILLHDGQVQSCSSPADMLASGNVERVFGVQTHVITTPEKTYYAFNRLI